MDGETSCNGRRPPAPGPASPRRGRGRSGRRPRLPPPPSPATPPRNYEFIEETIKQLDIVPKQVVIELLLAQITLTDTFRFSMEEIIRSGQFLAAAAFGGGPPGAAIAGG